MAKQRFVLQFGPSEVATLAEEYGYAGDEKAFEAGRRIAARNFDRENLEAIFRWKTKGRGISRLSRNTDAEIADALRLALSADSERSAVAVLKGLNGVNVPVASAILTAINPQKYTIIDFRAVESLGVRDGSTYSIDFYLGYLRKCRELAKRCNTSLRTLDRALWQWSSSKTKRARAGKRPRG